MLRLYVMNHPNPADYQHQLATKVERITQQFADFSPPTLSVFDSPPYHFRMRAEFRIWHTEDDLFYAMFERDEQQQKHVVKIEQFLIADQAISHLMQPLLAAIKQQPILAARLFEIDFLATLSGELLVSLIYHQHLSDDWNRAATRLGKQFNINIIGRSRGQKVVLSDDFITEQFSVLGTQYRYRQIENGFSQPNARVCEKMLNWAAEQAQQYADKNGDLLELYCGNGNFTLPLARHYRKVLATEIAKSSVQAADWAIQANAVDNIKIARLSAEEFSQALSGQREFRRLKDSGIDLTAYQFNTIFVDPPRSGIDDGTLKLMADFECIIYISCNADTLSDNVQQLIKTHYIVSFALFDQFPYTHHVECGMVLMKHK